MKFKKISNLLMYFISRKIQITSLILKVIVIIEYVVLSEISVLISIDEKSTDQGRFIVEE